MINVSEGEEEEESSEEKTESEEGEGSEESEEFPKLSIQDIELLMKNTEIWDNLLNGKISVDDAKRLFEETYKEYAEADSRKKLKGAMSKKSKKKSKKKEKAA
ncbi:MAG: RNA polymerase subunit Rpo13 [Sulfolobaceae archaeon]